MSERADIAVAAQKLTMLKTEQKEYLAQACKSWIIVWL